MDSMNAIQVARSRVNNAWGRSATPHADTHTHGWRNPMPLPESSLLHLSVSRSVASLAAVALASACAVTPSSSERTESTSSSQSSSVAVVDWSDDVVGTAHLGSYVELYGVFGVTDTVSIASVPLTV